VLYNKSTRNKDPINDHVAFYNFTEKISLWDSISYEQKRDVIDIAATYHSGEKAVELFDSGHIDKETSFYIFKKFMESSNYSTYFSDIVKRVSLLGSEYEKKFRDYLKSFGPSKKFAARALFCYKDITVDEEIAGLRSCTVGMSYELSNFIYELRFQPRASALKQMPTVMRLVCLEKLTGDTFTPYNIFGKINDDEEFKSLLFGPVLRHRERAEAIWDRYCELKHSGKPGKVTVKHNCDRCGEIKIIIESNVVRTKDRIQGTRFGEHILTPLCPICNIFSSTPVVHSTEDSFDKLGIS